MEERGFFKNWLVKLETLFLSNCFNFPSFKNSIITTIGSTKWSRKENFFGQNFRAGSDWSNKSKCIRKSLDKKRDLFFSMIMDPKTLIKNIWIKSFDGPNIGNICPKKQGSPKRSNRIVRDLPSDIESTP